MSRARELAKHQRHAICRGKSCTICEERQDAGERAIQQFAREMAEKLMDEILHKNYGVLMNTGINTARKLILDAAGVEWEEGETK